MFWFGLITGAVLAISFLSICQTSGMNEIDEAVLKERDRVFEWFDSNEVFVCTDEDSKPRMYFFDMDEAKATYEKEIYRHDADY